MTNLEFRLLAGVSAGLVTGASIFAGSKIGKCIGTVLAERKAEKERQERAKSAKIIAEWKDYLNAWTKYAVERGYWPINDNEEIEP